MKLNYGAYIQSKLASSISSLQNKARSIVSNTKKHTKAILAMGMMASGAHALPNESNIHYGSHTSSSSEWSITDSDGGDLDISDIKEILGAKIHYQSEVKNQQTSGYDTFIKMPHAPKYQINLTDQQQETIQGDIHQFRESISRELRHDLSSQAQSDALNLEGFATFVSIFRAPTTKQHIDTQTINIVGSASFDGDHAKNTILATNRAQYIHDLLSKNNQKNIAISTGISEATQLTAAEQSRLEAYAMQTKKTTKSLIQEHNLGKSFSGEIDIFLSQHLEEKQGVRVSSDVHFTRTITQDVSLSAYWLVLAGLGIAFRKKLKNVSWSLAQNMGRIKIWGQKIFSRNGSAHDARDRLRENLEEIRGEVDDPRIHLDDFHTSRTQEIIYHREPKKTWRQRFSDLFHRKQGSQKDLKDDTPLSSDIITERLKNLLATEGNDQRDASLSMQGQEGLSKGEIEKTTPQSQPLEPQQEPKTQPIKQDRWRPNARRAISAFDTLIEESILRSEDIPKGLIERKDLLRDLMKKESWDILEREIRSIIRILRTQHIQYTKQDKDDLLSHLDQFADDIAQRERFGRGYLSHTMSPYFVQKEIKNMKCTPIAYRIQDLTHFVPTTKFDLGYGEYVYLSNRVRAADGAKNDHIAIYTLHEGKLTGYIFEESRTTGEWKLLPSKQWEHSTLLDSITTQHNTHKTKSLGSLTIHSLNPEIISEIFKQPITSTMARSKIMQIFHTASPGSHHIDQAA